MTTKIPVELSSTPGIVDNSDATAITIDSSERVGIGITSPTTALEVIGDIKIKEGSAYSNYGLIDVSEAVLTLETYSVNTSSYPANIIFKPAGTERMRIDSNGNVLIGSTTSIASNIGLQVTGTDAAGFISLFRDDSSVVANDDLGGILFYGDDNSATTQLAYMRATAEGTHADGDNPTAIRFGTTADGSESVTERMKIDNAGRVTMPYQPAFEATVGTAFSGDGSVSGNETFIFSNARVNVGSHYNASTGIFTAPVTGLYQINYFLNPSSSNVTARYFRAKLIKTSGGTDTVIYNAHCTINNPAGDDDYNIVSASGVVSLTANDTLKVVFGSSLATSNYTFYVNLASFSGYLIG